MIESICVHCGRVGICQKAILDNKNVIMTGCSEFKERKPVTNADNLRSIPNDMQLAIFMASVDACPHDDRDHALAKCGKWNGACVSCWYEWLKQEATDAP